MSSDAPLSDHPRPKWPQTFFALFGGPIAWFVQLNIGFGLASQPCFRNGERTVAPHSIPDWTSAWMIGLMVMACAIALVAALISWRAYARTDERAAGDHRQVLEVGSGRRRFLAMWGILLGAGAALATAATTVAFWLLPRCAG